MMKLKIKDLESQITHFKKQADKQPYCAECWKEVLEEGE